VKFVRLYIQNFLTIGRAAVDLQDRGLHLIQGKNEDDGSASSNGAGKSSLVDAICWVLFGTTARGIKGDKVVNQTAKKDCSVQLTLRKGDSVYVVQRFRKHKDHKNSLLIQAVTASGAVDLHKGTEAESQKVLESILGCSQEVFMAAVYSGQEVMPDLPMKTDKELKTLVEEAAGLRRYERAYEIATKRRTTAQRELETAEAARTTLQAVMKRVEETLLKARANYGAWEKGRGVRVDEATVAVTEQELKLRTHLANVLASKKGHDAAVVRIAEIDTELEKHGELERAARDAETKHQAALRGIEKHKKDAAEKTIAQLEKQLEATRAGKIAPCESCGKTHTESEQSELIAHVETLLTTAKDNLAAVKALVLKQVTAATWAAAAATEARRKVPDVSAITAERTGLQAVVTRFQQGKDEIERMKAALDKAKEQVELRKTESNPHAATVTMLETQVAEHASKMGELTTQVATKQEALEIAESVVKVFGPAGVRAQILDTVTPFLNDRTADYLSVLSDGNMHATWTTLTKGAKGDLKEKFSIDVHNDKGSDNFQGLSGGEKKRVRLACGLALQDLVASRAANPIELWIGDEIDEAMDAAGLERLMTLLERKARERGTVLVISHNELRDWCDEVTVVRKKDGTSTVEGSLCV
jgi:DNA repair exonuclease SbcCD ATPase subunit